MYLACCIVTGQVTGTLCLVFSLSHKHDHNALDSILSSGDFTSSAVILLHNGKEKGQYYQIHW